MQPFTKEDLQLLLSEHQAPCISIYIPTLRAPAEWPQNALRFKNAVREVEKGLKKEWKAGAAEALKQLATLDNQDFWTQQRDTLAAFASPDFFRYWLFSEPMPEVATTDTTFHTKGLVKRLQGEVHYYVLALTKENVTLLEGTRETLDVVQVPGMPRGMRELEIKTTEPSLTMKNTTAAGASSGSVTYGTGRVSHDNIVKEDLRSLFRMVDKALLPLTHDQRVPLILARSIIITGCSRRSPGTRPSSKSASWATPSR